LVRREVQGVDLGLRQVVPAGDVALLPRPGEARRGLDQLLLPCPGKDRAQVLPGLIRRAARVRPFLGQGALVDPVQELADLLVLQRLDGGTAAPLLPFPDGRAVFIAGPAGEGLGAQVAFDDSLEGGRHGVAPAPPAPASLLDPLGRRRDAWCPTAGTSCRGRGRSSAVLVRRGHTKAYPTRRLKWGRTTRLPRAFDESTPRKRPISGAPV